MNFLIVSFVIFFSLSVQVFADEDVGLIHEIRLMQNHGNEAPVVTIRLVDDGDKEECATNTSKLIELDTEIGKYWYEAVIIAWKNDLPVWIRGTKSCKSKGPYAAQFEMINQIVLLSKRHGYLDK